MQFLIKFFVLLSTILNILSAAPIDLTDKEREWINDHPTIKVQSMVDSVPYNFIQDGQPQGYALENIKLIASKVGLKVDIVQGNSWSESMELLKKGKIDVMPNMVKTKTREEFFAFTSPYTPIMNVMYVKDGDFHPQSLDDLSGKTLSIAKGFSEIPLLKERYPDIKLHFTENGTEAFKLLSLGQVDATSYSIGAGNNIILKNALLNVVPAFEIKDKIFQKYLHMATNKNNTILRDILEKGLHAFSEQEKSDLRKKWLLNQLKQPKPNLIEFTKEEQRWIDENPEVSIGVTKGFPPFSYEKKGDHVGYEKDLLQLISQKSGLRFKIYLENWSTSLDNFKSNKTDMISSISYQKDRESFSLFTDPYYVIPNVIFIRDDFKGYDSLESLQDKRVGIVENVFYEEELRNLGYMHIVEYKTEEELTKALVFNKIDATIGSLTTINNLIKTNVYTNLKLVDELLLPNITKNDLRFGINPEKTLLYSIIKKTLSSISEDEKNELTNKWIVTQQSFNPLKETIELTNVEKEWIKNNPIIKVHNESNWPPYNYAKNGKPLGYSIDIMNLIAQKTGLQVDYVTGPTWNQFLDMMKDGSLDVMLNIVKTPERQKYLLYTPAYANNPNFIISRKDKSHPTLKSLFGKTVAITSGFFTEEALKKEYPQIDLLLVKDVYEGLKAVSYGKADATIVELAIFDYLRNDHMITNLAISGEAVLGDPEYSRLNIATRKDLPILQSILSKGVDAIEIQEKQELQKKWLGDSPIQQNSIDLTSQEQQYLFDKKEITMCIDPNWMPLEAFDKYGKHIGITSDYYKLFSTNLNKKFTVIKTDSWTQSLEFAQQRKCDILSLAMETPERSKYLHFTTPYLSIPLVIATKVTVPFINEISALDGFRVGIPKGYAFSELIKIKYPKIDIVDIKDIDEGLKQVSNGELYAYIGTLSSIGYKIQSKYIGELKITGKIEDNWELGIGVRSDDQMLLNILQKVVNSINESQKQKILNSWLSLKIEQSFDYKILIYIVAVFLVVIALISYRHYTIHKMNKELERISTTDALTNIYNRRYFNELFPKFINSAKRKNELISFIIIDVDHFKQYNDTYGHQMGDDALVKIARAIQDSLHRADDYCFRLGGEEFGAIFKVDSKEHSTQLANKIRENIESLKIEHSKNSSSLYITASMGLICKPADDIQNVDEFYKQGDDLLYRAKESGRNRVCVDN
jgi:diguanylate cyclase (GGDEF)-like protein